MTDKEIYQLCSTEDGCIKYLRENRQNYFYKWSYLDSNEAPALNSLLEKKIIEKRINKDTNVEEWRMYES